MSFKLARFMIFVCLLFGRLNALIEPLTSERFVYEEQLLKKVIRIEVWMEQMEREMSQRKTLEQLTLEVENKIAEMSQTHENLKNTLGNLTLVTENKIAEMSQTHENVKNTLGNLTLATENKIAEMSQAHDKMKTNLDNLTLETENKIAELKLVEERVSLPMIAFNAYGLADRSLDTNQIVVFGNTYLNEGNGYDNVDGVFTTPVGGLYMFSMHACSYNGKYFNYYIVVDNNIIARSTKYNSAGYDCSSVVTLTKLEKDQRVWVKCANGSSGKNQLHEDVFRQCTFSGVLLHG